MAPVGFGCGTTSYTYDELSRTKTIETPAGLVVSYGYDDAGQVEAIIDPLGNRTTTTYDDAGQVKDTVDAENHRTTMSYDALGRAKATQNALGDITTTVYDEVGRTKELIDARGKVTTFLYDEAGNQDRQIDPLGRRTTWTYDDAGQQKTRLDARGQLTTYQHTGAGQLEARQYTSDANVTMSYDSRGNRKTMADGTGTTSYTYDELSRTKTVETPAGQVVSYGYDNAGQREHMIEPGGGRFTYAYTKSGQIRTLDNPQDERTTYTYDAAGRETLKELGNNTYASMSYDAANRLDVLENVKSSGAIISKFTYTYDKSGNRTNVAEDNGDRVTWTYDDTYQLTREQRSGADAYDDQFTYDAVGNRTVKNEDGALTTSTYDGTNQLQKSVASVGTTTYTYDDAGNQHTFQEPDGDLTTYTWNDENRQTKVELPDGKITTATYRADGLRHEKQDSSGITKYIWDGTRCLAETDGSDALQVVYTQSGGTYGRVISQRRKSGASWDSSYYNFDALGSVESLDNASESSLNTYLYKAFGAIHKQTGTTTNPFTYDGEYNYYRDSDTGLYIAGVRLLDPVIAVFLTIDPSFDQANLYWYVDNNPINFIDPSGNSRWKPVVGGEAENNQGIDISEEGFYSTPAPVPVGEETRNRLFIFLPAEDVDSHIGRKPPFITNLKDILDFATNLTGDDKVNCMSTLEVNGHANPYQFWLGKIRPDADDVKGKTVETNLIHASNAEFVGKALSTLPFCKPCRIILTGCHTGNLIKSALQVVAKESGCTVWGTLGYSHLSVFDGNVRISFQDNDWHVAGQTIPGRANAWRRFDP